MIQIKIEDWLDQFLTRPDCPSVESRQYIIAQLQALDPSEKLIHIEPFSHKEKTSWRIYRIQAWRESTEKNERLKLQSEKDRSNRAERDVAFEHVKRLAESIAAKTNGTWQESMLLSLALVESGIPGILEAYGITPIEISKETLKMVKLKINYL